MPRGLDRSLILHPAPQQVQSQHTVNVHEGTNGRMISCDPSNSMTQGTRSNLPEAMEQTQRLPEGDSGFPLKLDLKNWRLFS